MILGRSLDAEGSAQILNLAKLTIVGAATSANEPMRKQEYDADITAITDRLTAVETSAAHIDNIYVDTTSLNLAESIATASFANGIWTFPGNVALTTGDLLKLNAATNQDSDRLWIIKNNPQGTISDFEQLGIDVDVVIQSYIDGVLGGATNAFNTLGKAEAAHNALADHMVTAEGNISLINTELAVRGEYKTLSIASWTDNGDGTYSASGSNPFSTTEVSVMVQSDLGSGKWQYRFPPEYDITVTTSTIELVTASATLAGAGVKLLMTAIEVI